MGLRADVLSNKTDSQTRVLSSQVAILHNVSQPACDSPHLALLLWCSLFFPTFSGRQLFVRTAAAAIHRGGGDAITKTQPMWRFFADPFLFRRIIPANLWPPSFFTPAQKPSLLLSGQVKHMTPRQVHFSYEDKSLKFQ